jgi:hypothetical protein
MSNEIQVETSDGRTTLIRAQHYGSKVGSTTAGNGSQSLETENNAGEFQYFVYSHHAMTHVSSTISAQWFSNCPQSDLRMTMLDEISRLRSCVCSGI